MVYFILEKVKGIKCTSNHWFYFYWFAYYKEISLKLVYIIYLIVIFFYILGMDIFERHFLVILLYVKILKAWKQRYRL